jgi:uncharacterized protein YdeI (YjbR/CyaY-like superfamily)
VRRVKPFFRTAAEFRDWLERNHGTARELWVGYYKKGSGRPSITGPESVDDALFFGWIDGLRKSLDIASYAIRFSPRKPRSTWSNVNIKRAEKLIAEGRMRPAGLGAYGARRENRSGVYSYDQRRADLPEPYDGILKQNTTACEFFRALPPSHRKAIYWWIVSAKREETRLKRLEKLIAHSVQGRTLPELTAMKRAR